MGNESVPSQLEYKKNDTDHVQSLSIKFSASFWRQTVSERSSACFARDHFNLASNAKRPPANRRRTLKETFFKVLLNT